MATNQLALFISTFMEWAVDLDETIIRQMNSIMPKAHIKLKWIIRTTINGDSKSKNGKLPETLLITFWL